MSNSITVVGRLGRDAEIKEHGERQFLTFSVADDVGFGDRKHTIWHSCSYWRASEGLARYMTKGTLVMVSGDLDVREYKGKDGETKFQTQISVNSVALHGSRDEREQSTGSSPAPTPSQENDGDDIPF